MATNDSSKDNDFWTEKIKRIFNILYDKDGDGEISSKDFEISLDNIKAALKWEDKDAIAIDAKKTLDIVWGTLQKYADKNDDHKVSQEEWLKMWQDCINDQSLPEWQIRFRNLMFDVNDTSNDKEIDKNEYTLFWNKAYEIEQEECSKAFDMICPNKNAINKEEFDELWKEYFLCTDKTVKGNYLFGVPTSLK